MSAPGELPEKLVRGLWVKGLADDRTPELDAELKDVGLDLQAIPPVVPRLVWIPALRVTAARLCPDPGADASLRNLGLRLVAGLERKGVFQGAGFTVARFLGPRRILKELGPRLAGLGVGLSVDVRELGARDVEVRVNEPDGAPFLAGALEGLLRVIGARNPSVGVSPLEGGAVLRLSWA